MEKRLDEKDNADFKIYDVTTWKTNNCDAHMVQYFKKEMQSDYEIWSVNRRQHEKHFSLKIKHKMC